ncbi:MAG: diaminopimelate decarboxylase, partial [Gemmatimonadota bacterium]|nr:diaminopimelate decarboxylase [Gemmatimonadota bacterium]
MSRPSGTLLEAIAATAGTPTYVYSAESLETATRRWVAAAGDPGRIYFAAKANTNLAVLDRLRGTGIGIEVATAGERARAERAGFPRTRILLGGVPKSADVVAEGIGSGLALVVLQADHEVDAAVAAADPALPTRVGLRVRPGIRAGAHPSLETGRADAKFGYAPEEVVDAWSRLAATPGLDPDVLAVHLGSGIGSLEPWDRALDVLLDLAERLAAHGTPVREFDLGGGLGVDYESDDDPDPSALIQRVDRRLEGTGLSSRFEPGRSVVARAGFLVTRVLYRREHGGKPALVCDAGFTDFARFALYGAQHRIEALDGATSGPATVDVLGPTCESGDVIGTDRSLHEVRPGDLLVVRDVGAYGFV